MTARQRADRLLVERGLLDSRARAQAAIAAGLVTADGVPVRKASDAISTAAAIEAAPEHPYVSRGGVKLAAALDEFALDVTGRVCLDVGASTGGFTDCLLQHGARRVYAVDVSSDQLDWKLRQDARVAPVEKNARYLRPEDLADDSGNTAAEFVTIDVSFISVVTILPAVVAAAPQAEFLILVKPQFELPRADVGAGGIVRDAALHQRAIERVRAAAVAAGLEVVGVCASRLPGAEGNQELFIYARRPTS